MLTLFLAALLWGDARAQEVNLRNANLYYEVEDVRVQKPGVSLELIRSYNSRTNRVGYFGYGWSTNLDISCEEAPDGSILVTDSDGFILRFTPEGEPRERLTQEYASRLARARRDQDTAMGQARSASWYTDLEQELIAQPELRQSMGMALSGAWLDAEVGQYISYDRGTQRLEKRQDGSYLRTLADGTTYEFNYSGDLTRMVDASGRGMRLDYDRDRRLVKVTHTEGGSVSLTYNSAGYVGEILDTESRRISFSYNDTGDLLQVIGPGERRLAYRFDDTHNLTAARTADGGGFQISYDQEKDWAQAVKVGDDVTRYNWTSSGDTYTCEVTDPAGAVTRHTFNDAESRSFVLHPDGTTTETLLSACCAKPLEIRDSEGTTRYDYDQEARLTSIEHPDGRIVRFAYHPTWSRIVQAMHSDGRRYVYTYDQHGNMIEASDGRQRKLALSYGNNGKVSEIRDESGSRYTFTYDNMGRPTAIAQGQEGSLSIRYGANGEIQSTEILEGDSSRTEFYSSLREVLSMLEPATGELQ